jgi:hypothetical protein
MTGRSRADGSGLAVKAYAMSGEVDWRSHSYPFCPESPTSEVRRRQGPGATQAAVTVTACRLLVGADSANPRGRGQRGTAVRRQR